MNRVRFTILFLIHWVIVDSFAVQAQVAPAQLPGPDAHGWADLSLTDTALGSPNVDVRLHYPATTAGNGAPVALGTYPVIAFGHGFNMSYDDYENLCGHLASWGYFVIAPDVQNGFSVDHEEFARELAASIRYVWRESADTTSPFYNRADTACGVFGHSMGGGASALVHTVFPTIDAVGGMAAAETNPSAIGALGTYDGPLLVIGGTDDNVAGESGNQIPMYNAAIGEKVRLSLNGAGHCKYSDGATVCDFVSAPGALTNARQQELANKYHTAFFNVYLKKDTAYRSYLCGDSLAADTANGTLTFENNLGNCGTLTAVSPPQSILFEVYPNPASQEIRVRGPRIVEIWDGQGRLLKKVATAEPLRVQDMPRGIYLLRDPQSGNTKSLILQ